MLCPSHACGPALECVPTAPIQACSEFCPLWLPYWCFVWPTFHSSRTVKSPCIRVLCSSEAVFSLLAIAPRSPPSALQWIAFSALAARKAIGRPALAAQQTRINSRQVSNWYVLLAHGGAEFGGSGNKFVQPLNFSKPTVSMNDEAQSCAGIQFQV